MSKARFQLPDLNKIIDSNELAGNRVEEAAEACVESAGRYLYEEMSARLAAHKRTGRALESLERKPTDKQGAVYTSQVGAFFNAENGGFMHAVFQEYGTPTFPKDPWLRPVMDNAPKALKKIYTDIIRSKLGE